MKIRPLGAVFFHAERQTGWKDMTLVDAFRYFKNEPKKLSKDRINKYTKYMWNYCGLQIPAEKFQ